MYLRRLLRLAFFAMGAMSALGKEEEPEIPEDAEKIVKSNLDVTVSTSFPQSEIFGVKMVNGLTTQAQLSFNNQDKIPVRLAFVGATLWAPDPSTSGETSILVRNLTSARFNSEIPAGQKEMVTYEFSTIMHPQNLRLSIMAVLTSEEGHVFSLNAFNETVSIVEPDASFFDPQLIFLYLLLVALFVGSCYFIYNTWIATLFPQKPKSRSDKGKKAGGSTKKVDTTGEGSNAEGATTTGAKTYDESWIPEHHLNRPEARRVKSSGKPKSKGKAE